MGRLPRDDLWVPKDSDYPKLVSKIKVDKEGCWIWTASTHVVTGYGSFRVTSKVVVKPHRWMYRFFIGEIPVGLEPDHQCKKRACCNPWCLDLVTPKVNNQRASLRTHCSKCGKAYEGNLSKEPGKRCNACRRAYQRVYALKRYHETKVLKGT